MSDLNSDPYRFLYKVRDNGLVDSVTMEHDTDRVERISTAWNFYFAKHWTFEREDQEPLITINYCRALVDKKISFLVGEGFTLNVPAALQSKTLPLLQKAWDDNGRQRLPFEIVQEGSVTGDCFIMVTLAPPSPEILRFDPLMKYRVVVQRLNSHECFPVWDENIPADRYGRRLRAFEIRRKLRRLKKGSRTSRPEYEDVDYSLYITDDEIITTINNDEKRVPNKLTEIPVVHIPNKASSRTLFGIDDMTDLISLNREYNEKSTDISDAINYNAHPIVVLTGARAKALERGPRAIWSGLPVGAKVELLTLQGDFTAAVSYLERLKKAMHEISNVPEGSLGQLQPITGTSGDTLHMTYAPLIDERNKKKATYEPGFERVNYFILRYAELEQGLKLPMGICEKCGGKIAITYMDDPQDVEAARAADRDPEQIEVRRCYVLDPETYDFMAPEKHKILVVRQHSFGQELTDIPLEQAEQEHGVAQSSYWDLEPVVDTPPSTPDGADEVPPRFDGNTGAVTTTAADAPVDPAAAPPTGTPQLPEGFTLPPEPEVLNLPEVVVEYDDIEDTNGQPLRVSVQKARNGVRAVPIECDEHSFLSPYTNYVSFNDTLPKDRAAQANLFTQYDALQIVSKEWMMSQIGVENIPAMQKAIREEQRMEIGVPGRNVAKTPNAGMHLIRQPGVVQPSTSVTRGVPPSLKAKRPASPGTNGSGSNTSTSI